MNTLPPNPPQKTSSKGWKFQQKFGKTEKQETASPQPTADSAVTPGADARAKAEAKSQQVASKQGKKTGEVGGPKGLEPTRYGDWEVAGRCTDF